MSDKSSFNDFTAKQLEAHIHTIQQAIDHISEKVITLNAEYLNDRQWIHNTLKEHTAAIDRLIDKTSRVEGKLENGLSSAVVELKQSVNVLDKQLQFFVNKDEVDKIEKRILDKIADQIAPLRGQIKDDKSSRRSNTTTTLMIVGELLTFIGLLYTILSLT